MLTRIRICKLFNCFVLTVPGGQQVDRVSCTRSDKRKRCLPNFSADVNVTKTRQISWTASERTVCMLFYVI